MFKKLRNKFIILNMAVTSLVVLTAFSVVYITTYSNIKAENQQKLNNVVGAFVISDSNNPKYPDTDISSLESFNHPNFITSNKVTTNYSPSFIITVDKEGKVRNINSFIDMPIDRYVKAASTAWNGKGDSTITIENRYWMYKIAPLQVKHMNDGKIVQSNSTEYFQISFLDITDMQKNLNNLLSTFLFVGIGTLAVVFFISILYAKRSIQPIEEAWEKQKQFVADASHELKTPLTTIMTNCDVLEVNEDETIKSQKEWLDYIRIGADRMSKLVNSLLTLARVEGMSVQVEKHSFDVAVLIFDVMQSIDTAAQAKNLSISRKIEFIGNIFSYEESVRQVFTILYENAVKYANEGGNIDVSVCRTKKGILFTVKNTGKGIPHKDLPYIFDRFYRVDDARNSEENSYGLGLSIAKSITEQIGGRITANSIENEWTEFTFEI